MHKLLEGYAGSPIGNSATLACTGPEKNVGSCCLLWDRTTRLSCHKPLGYSYILRFSRISSGVLALLICFMDSFGLSRGITVAWTWAGQKRCLAASCGTARIDSPRLLASFLPYLTRVCAPSTSFCCFGWSFTVPSLQVLWECKLLQELWDIRTGLLITIIFYMVDYGYGNYVWSYVNKFISKHIPNHFICKLFY